MQEETAERLANGLGWFSIGLGAAELLAPGSVARLIGVNDDDGNRSLLRFYGLREIAAGVGILTQSRPAGWLWGRVGGDLLDLATLGSAMSSDWNQKGKLAAATAAVLGVTALDVICAQQISSQDSPNSSRRSGTRDVCQAVRINKSPDEVYHFWRQLDNLPRFMSHIKSVTDSGNGRTHWRATGPMDTTLEWDAETTEDQPGKVIAWRSLENADVYNAGRVTFERAPGGRGTFVRVQLEYAPPGGAVTALAAKLMGQAPEQQVYDDLRHFKQILETGEIVRSDASIHKGMHPGQPSEQRLTEEQMRSPEPVLA